MALTNADITGAWTLQLKNASLQGRLQVGGLFSQANVQNSALTPMGVWRSGVIPSSSFTGTYYDLLVIPSASPSLSVQVYPGSFIVTRPSNAVYQGYSSALVSVTTSNADPTNPRLDLIVARVEDAGVGDSFTRAQIQVITGVPAGAPTAPAAPAGSVPLATVRVNALATTITSAQVTDVRKSVGVLGTVRRLLPGDALTDVGFRDGELRDVGTSIDRWTDSTSTWVPIVLLGVGNGYARYTNNGTGLLSCAANGGDGAIAFNNPVNTSAYITASGTNNTTFTINKTGKCSFSVGVRWKTDATLPAPGGDWYFRAILVAGGIELVGETEKASVGYGVNTFFVKEMTTTRYFTAGDQIQAWFANGTAQSATLSNGGELIFISFQWEGP